MILGAALVAVAAVAGFAVQRTLTDRPSLTEDPNSRVSTRGTPATGAAGSADGLAGTAESADRPDDAAPKPHPIPMTLPDLALPDGDGVTRHLSDWKGRPVVVNFWATWCGPCRDEIPLLKTLRNERSRDRLEVVGIAIDQREAVMKYARDIGIDYPVLIGEKDGYAAAEAFGVTLVLPFSVFADSEGRIVTLKVGELHANEAAFILDRVRDIDMKRLDLATAREQIASRMRELAIERGKQTAESEAQASARRSQG